MPPRPRPVIYRAVAWKDPVGIGATGTRYVELEGYGKLNSDVAPYCVPNEYVANRLTALLGLPAPPGAVLLSPEGPAWVSLAFADRTERLPPVDPTSFVTAAPQLAAGIVVFDLLIANRDRHAGNVSIRPSSNRVDLFDHSHSAFGIVKGMANKRLVGMRGRFVIDGVPIPGAETTPGNRHCLVDYVRSPADLLRWAEQIQRFVGDYQLDAISSDVAALDCGVAAEEAIRLKIELRHRRDELAALIGSNQAEFRAISEDDWRSLV